MAKRNDPAAEVPESPQESAEPVLTVPNATSGTASTAPAAEATKPGIEPLPTFYATRRIFHEDKVIFRGQPIPEGIPQDSLKLLLQSGDIATEPPGDTQVVTAAKGVIARP